MKMAGRTEIERDITPSNKVAKRYKRQENVESYYSSPSEKARHTKEECVYGV